MKASGKRTVFYSYPVELVWKAIGAGNNREFEAMTEEEYENKEPAPNTIFTRALEVVPNERFSFRMKARGFIADMCIDMNAIAPCETKVVISETVEYRTTAAYVFSRFGLQIRTELKSFAVELNKRLDDMMHK